MPVLLDLAVVAVVLLAAAGGWRRGGLSVVVRLVALVAGLVVGLTLAGLLSDSLSPVAHVALGLLCVFGGVVVAGALGRRLLRTAVPHAPGIVNRVAGAVLRGAVAALVCGLLASAAAAFGPPSWAAAVDEATLAPGSPADVPVAGRVWTRLGDVLRAGAPDDLSALVPSTSLAGPAEATIAAVDRAAGAAVVPIAAGGCGNGVTGTGFVAADGLVVTNAHVVAGAGSVRAGDADATVVAIDERTDLAVLRAPDLDATALPLATSDAANGAALVVVGYPDSGPRSAIGAVVVQRLPVPNPGLAGGSLHQAYRLRADIHHGNSGSPLLDASGRVVGVVNALAGGSQRSGRSGFAISLDELRPLLATASARTAAVATGACRSTP